MPVWMANVPVEADFDLALTAEDAAALRQRCVEMIRNEFSSVHWEAFCLLVQEGHTVRDVAARFGLTPNAVSIAKARIMSRFREEFAELID